MGERSFSSVPSNFPFVFLPREVGLLFEEKRSYVPDPGTSTLTAEVWPQ